MELSELEGVIEGLKQKVEALEVVVKMLANDHKDLITPIRKNTALTPGQKAAFARDMAKLDFDLRPLAPRGPSVVHPRSQDYQER